LPIGSEYFWINLWCFQWIWNIILHRINFFIWFSSFVEWILDMNL
jgi:hypothetical protein